MCARRPARPPGITLLLALALLLTRAAGAAPAAGGEGAANASDASGGSGRTLTAAPAGTEQDLLKWALCALLGRA